GRPGGGQRQSARRRHGAARSRADRAGLQGRGDLRGPSAPMTAGSPMGPWSNGPGTVRHWRTMRTPDEIRISNRATYWPVAPIDLVIGAPLVVRALLGVTPLGRVVQAAVLGAYLGSAVRDWHDRRGIRRIDFRREFGADLHHLVPMPREAREAEVRTLAERLNDE